MSAGTGTIAILVAGTLTGAAFAQADRFSQWDRDGNGKLSRDELPDGPRRNFDRADTDKDGWISRAEHVAFLRRGTGRTNAPRLPQGVTLQADIAYVGNDNPRQRLDLLLPARRLNDRPLPVIAFIHGGGWRNGDKRSGLARLAPYVATGRYAGVSIGYRLTGEAKWPAQIRDCKAAIRWIKAHADRHQLDPNRIGAWGTSAGGHLVAMLGVSGGVEELEAASGPKSKLDGRVTCVVDFFGPTELLSMNDRPTQIDHNAADSPEGRLIGGALPANRDRARHASPMTYVTADDAPILIMHGTKDPLVPYDQSVRFHAALKAADVSSTLISVTGAGHGLRGPQVEQRVSRFFQRHLLGADLEIPSESIPAAAGR